MGGLATLLRGATILIELLGLGLTVWLGLALLSLAPRRGRSWLAAMLCWAFSLVFALNLLQLGRPLVPDRPWLPYELLRWVLIPLPLAWLWLLQDLLPVRLRRWLRPLRRTGVLFVLVLIAIAALTRPWPGLSGAGWVAWEWLFYPFYLVVVAATIGPALLLAWRGARSSDDPGRRDTGYALVAATVLALFGAFYRVGGWWLWPEIPVLPGDLALLSGIVALGLALVFRDIAEGRTNGPAFVYSLTNAAAITLLYVAVVGVAAALLRIAWVVLIPVVVLAVSTHWLTDWSRTLFDTVFYRAPLQRLRADLRALTRTLDGGEALEPQLRLPLARLARQTGAELVALAVVREDDQTMPVVAAYPAIAERAELPRAPLTLDARAPVRLAAPGGFRGRLAWAVPLPAGEQQLGVLVAWAGQARSFNDLDLALLEEVGGQLALLLSAWEAQGARRAEIERLVAAYRAQAETLRTRVQALVEEEGAGPELAELEREARRWIEELLRRLHDVAYLGQHPVAGLRVVEARVAPGATGTVTHLERGQAVRRLCEELIERLRPSGDAPAEPLSPEWRLYTVLHAAYVEDLPNREIMSRLSIGEGTFHRARRQALTSLADALVELEREAARARPPASPAQPGTNRRAPPPGVILPP